MKLEANQTLGSYRVVRQLGAGGMGSVYEVEHIKLGTHYALKTHTVMGEHAGFFRRRFLAEGKILSRLSHPGLVRVIDLDYDEGLGILYYVMDLVLYEDGAARTLGDFEPGSVPERQLFAWFRELCDVLAYVHEQGIVHRDIKLTNILVRPDGHVVLSDFGISKICDESLRCAVDVTQTVVTDGTSSNGMVFGTRDYIAPEVARGREATKAADVYSLGVTFFKLLTNVWYDPCLAPSADKDSGTAINAAKLLSPFAGHWADVLLPMLEEDPAKRPLNLLDLPGFVNPAPAKPRRIGIMRVLVVGLLAEVALAAAAVLFLRSSDGDSPAAVRSPRTGETVPGAVESRAPVSSSHPLSLVEATPSSRPQNDAEADDDSFSVEKIVDYRFRMCGTCDTVAEASAMVRTLSGKHEGFSSGDLSVSEDGRSFAGEVTIEGPSGHPPDAVRVIEECLKRGKSESAVRKWDVKLLR